MKVPKKDYKKYPKHLDDIVWCSENFMNERIDRLMEHMRKDEKIVRYYGYCDGKDLPKHVILYGVGLKVTVSNLIKFTLYNTSYYVPNIDGKICGVEVIADPNTLEYKLKFSSYYGSFNYVKEIKPIIKSRADLDEETRIYFDGIVAYTLWCHKYGSFPTLHPIMEKDIQVMVLGEIVDDDFSED